MLGVILARKHVGRCRTLLFSLSFKRDRSYICFSGFWFVHSVIARLHILDTRDNYLRYLDTRDNYLRYLLILYYDGCMVLQPGVCLQVYCSDI